MIATGQTREKALSARSISRYASNWTMIRGKTHEVRGRGSVKPAPAGVIQARRSMPGNAGRSEFYLGQSWVNPLKKGIF